MTNNTKSKLENNQPDFYEPLERVLPIAEQLQGLVLRRARTGILQMLKATGTRTVLDVCCGTGCLVCRLSMAGLEVTGVDSLSNSLLRIFRPTTLFDLIVRRMDGAEKVLQNVGGRGVGVTLQVASDHNLLSQARSGCV